MKYIVKDGEWQAWNESRKPIPEELLPFVQDSLPEPTQEEKEELRIMGVNQQIQAKLPELMCIIALDDSKGFEDLKAEIKKIDQSVRVEDGKVS